VRRAYEGDCAAGSVLLDEVLALPHRKDGEVLEREWKKGSGYASGQ